MIRKTCCQVINGMLFQRMVVKHGQNLNPGASKMEILFSHHHLCQHFSNIRAGRCFWVGNMTNVNCRTIFPAGHWLLLRLIPENLKLIRSSLLTVDTQHQEDLSQGRLDISHVTLIEDRETKEIILTYPRNTNTYKTTEWITVRFSVSKKNRRRY